MGKRRVKLSDSEKERINKALRELHDLQDDIAALAACDEDCTEFEEMRNTIVNRLNALKERFA